MHLASLGNATGQRQVALMYATGIGVDRDYALAHLYMGLAVIEGDVIAEQAMGYWKLTGIATLKGCDDSVFYYYHVANIGIFKMEIMHSHSNSSGWTSSRKTCS